ncbi:hypothetical protein H2200_007978 [Cladophialophora chaetospira]|uniref:Carboxylesterase type B domain-containing protein n=1 Tax=Cladophialophora chaetospira TaxID=386627 RepID=A0AA38X6V5_9EURO|nr:hypothetical protein H2200_007978 [Cladophialophora chaetospira]
MASPSTPATSGRRPYTGPTHTHQHPQLGSLKGRLINSPHFTGASVVQFCSIPYAKVPKRFAPCLRQDSIPDQFDGRPHRDFTQLGAACPQPGAMKPGWFDAYGGALEDDLGMEFDEFTCLTVSISVPEDYLPTPVKEEDSGKLPVMVYIHGGGAQEGVGHVDGLHSNAPLAAYSSELLLPAITVNIGYRLNWLGSLVCQDVLDEYNADPSTSPHGPFNLTIQDQRAAFEWIHKFIGGFGGDSNNITAFGESAGSILLIYQISGSPEKLFNRVILQSGVIFGDVTFEQKCAEYQGLLIHFGIEGATSSERLERLRKIPAEALAKYPSQHILPFVGDVPGFDIEKPLFPRGRPTFLNQLPLVASCPWLEDIVIGDDFWEGYTLKDFLRGVTAKRFVDFARLLLPGDQVTRLTEVYDLPSTLEHAARMDRNLFYGNLTYLMGDLILSQPIQMLANHLALESAKSSSQKRKIYRYSFGLTNPIPGSDHSFVTGHHFVEILFLFLTLLDRYPRHREGWLATQAKETAKRWILFASGQEPWDEYIVSQPQHTASAKIAICDDLRGWHVKTVSEDEKVSQTDPWGRRRYAGWEAIEEAYQSLRTQGADEEAWSRALDAFRLGLLGSLIGAQNEADTGNETQLQSRKTSAATDKDIEKAEEEVAKVL